MPRIARGWASYFDLVVPVGAGEAQRTQLKQAFYAGALILFNEIMGASNLPEADGERVLSDIDAELRAFGKAAEAAANGTAAL